MESKEDRKDREEEEENTPKDVLTEQDVADSKPENEVKE